MTNRTLPRTAGQSVAALVDPPSDASISNIILIERRMLIRECLAQCLKLSTEFNVVAYPTAEEWLRVADKVPASLIVICIAGKGKDPAIERDVAYLSQLEQAVPMVLLSDSEDLDQILAALEQGARGVIPTSLTLTIAVEAMRLVKAGGTYLPASSIMAAKQAHAERDDPKKFCNGMFTARQAAVVEAIRRGKANKTIAYELKMRESTVKVHVRSIMKKLKAHNRTEVAFIANGLLSGDPKYSEMG